jgi:hypothetical protein
MIAALCHFPTYIITAAFRVNLVVEPETVLMDSLSLSSSEVAGVDVGGNGKERKLTDSELGTDGETLLWHRGF